MENIALLNFINEACKQDDTNIDISIAELTSAIKTLEDEKRKREIQKREVLIGNFKKAYRALYENNIRVSYDFDTDEVNEIWDEYSNEVRLTLENCDFFVFN